MRQLLLDLGVQQAPTFETFVSGQNAELLQRLQDIGAAQALPPLHDRFIYLWGASGAGKTHLLQSLAQICTNSRYITANADVNDFDYDPAVSCYLLDDCEQLSAASQIAAFNLFNQIREQGGFLVSSGALPPAQLQERVREDLRTRLSWGLIYQLHGLTDDEKIAALTQSAQARGMTVSPAILSYLLTHYRRDMPSLSHMLDELDHYSLETKRPITLPLLRDLLLQQPEDITP